MLWLLKSFFTDFWLLTEKHSFSNGKKYLLPFESLACPEFCSAKITLTNIFTYSFLSLGYLQILLLLLPAPECCKVWDQRGANKTEQQKTTTTKTKHETEHIHTHARNQTWHRKGIKTETQFLFFFLESRCWLSKWWKQCTE